MLSGIGFLFIAEPVTMDYCIMIGSILLAVAGLNLAISNYSMSCLSGASSGMVMALLCGGFDESSSGIQIIDIDIRILYCQHFCHTDIANFNLLLSLFQ